MKLFIFSAFLILASCTSEGAPSAWVKPKSTVLSCEDYRSIAVDAGVLYNNVWNKHADKSGKGVQCLVSRTVDGVVQYGWSWSWPEGERVIYAYPQIKRGASPWSPKPNIDERFPVVLSSLNRLKLSFETETETNGIHNLAASMWLTEKPINRDAPNPSTIAAEVMIWTYSKEGHFDPAGKKIDEISLDGADWEVWTESNWKDVSGKNQNRWTYITYRSTKNSMHADIDLLKLLTYAVERNLITENLYVSNLELGNEIMSGSGITWVTSFKITIN